MKDSQKYCLDFKGEKGIESSLVVIKDGFM